jgi:hypothetical protein
MAKKEESSSPAFHIQETTIMIDNGEPTMYAIPTTEVLPIAVTAAASMTAVVATTNNNGVSSNHDNNNSETHHDNNNNNEHDSHYTTTATTTTATATATNTNTTTTNLQKRKRGAFDDEFVDDEPVGQTLHAFLDADQEQTQHPPPPQLDKQQQEPPPPPVVVATTTMEQEQDDEDDSEEIGSDEFPLQTDIEQEQVVVVEQDENTIIEFNEERFFSTSSFTPQEIAMIEPVLLKAMQAPLIMVEENGHAIFQAYLQEREQRKLKSQALQLERTQQALYDSTIRGDPREYQRALFEIAKSKNTIVNLGTGFGKTLIALLCIRHFSPAFEPQPSQPNDNNGEDKDKGKRAGGKQTLFMVPSVALAIQQSTTLRANLPGFSVQTACYASSNSEASRQALANANVIVATHGAVRTLRYLYTRIGRASGAGVWGGRVYSYHLSNTKLLDSHTCCYCIFLYTTSYMLC